LALAAANPLADGAIDADQARMIANPHANGGLLLRDLRVLYFHDDAACRSIFRVPRWKHRED